MSYVIKPDENEFRKARQSVQTILTSLESRIDAGDFELFLNWQDFGRPATVQTAKDEILLILNTGYEWEEDLQRTLTIGLLELEFRKKTDYGEMDFTWQEIAMMSYVKAREPEFTGEEVEFKEVEVDRESIIEELSRPETEFSEILYENAGHVAGLIGKRVRENGSMDQLPSMKKSDIEELVKQVL